MRIADPLLAELNAEAAATQRVLERDVRSPHVHRVAPRA